MKRPRNILWLIIFLTFLAAIIDFPKNLPLKFQIGKLKVDKVLSGPDIDFSLGNLRLKRELDLKTGLDLAGGTHLVYQAEMTGIAPADRAAAAEAVRNNIERRVNFFGVSEPTIQTAKIGEEYRLIVELPGIQNINQAIDLIGKTALLDFREYKDASEAAQRVLPTVINTKETGFTGADFKIAKPGFDQNTGEPLILFETKSESAKKFADLTTRLVGQPLVVFLDGVSLSAPTVQEPITDGSGQITGQFTVEEVKNLSRLLNAGALPVPIKIIGQRNIGASLGQESVQKSVRAGLVGLLMVIAFMWAYYGRLGFLADLALIVYGLITLALYKLIPVTLTLPGVAGFILSVGMAVDANILIFERMKEEMRWGKPRQAAMQLGFGRAWDSIRDANVCTLITCFILFNPLNWNFLNVSGPVRGFALTLGLGIFIGLFTGVVVTRTLLRMFYRGSIK